MYIRNVCKISKTDKMTMDPTLAKRVEQAPCKPTNNYRNFYWVFIYDCANNECGNEIRVSEGQLYKATGFCRSCAIKRKHKPYQHLWSSFLAGNKHRNIKVDMTFDEFALLMKETECHYCKTPIQRDERSKGTKNGKRQYSSAYMLDRKDPNLGYTNDNCVSCCTECNMIRRKFFTYDEFLLLSSSLQQIMKLRRMKNKTGN